MYRDPHLLFSAKGMHGSPLPSRYTAVNNGNTESVISIWKTKPNRSFTQEFALWTSELSVDRVSMRPTLAWRRVDKSISRSCFVLNSLMKHNTETQSEDLSQHYLWTLICGEMWLMSNTEFGSRLIDKALTVIKSYENAICNRHDKLCKLICTTGCIGAKIGQESLLGHRVVMIKWPEGCCVHLYSVTYIQYTHRENFKLFISLKKPKTYHLEHCPLQSSNQLYFEWRSL